MKPLPSFITRLVLASTCMVVVSVNASDKVETAGKSVPEVSPAASQPVSPAGGTATPVTRRRQAAVEVFVKSDCRQCESATAFVERLAKQRDDLVVTISNVEDDPDALRRLYALCKEQKITKVGLPGIFASDRMLIGFRDDETTGRQVEELVGLEVFSQDGCPHCVAAKRFLDDLVAKTPGLKITYRNISREPGQHQRMQALAQKNNIAAPSVPFISAFGRVQVGFERPETTGRQLKDLVDKYYPLEPTEATVGAN
ncbi:MAG: hypothetical protein NT069_09540 [Planctomycetota bacterium]|nr:hypothetical protein [Planctomycetota bacterium]